MPLAVKVDENEPFEKALRRFKKQMMHSGILKNLRENAYYTKPSEKKKVAKRKAIRLQRKQRHHN
ncbi:MAG: 30S ribosomal protein S21 [Calditrichaeota bacterium]|nr:MAG: 30S ribosomal protein S21 [Calditrichota bacterium]